MSNFTLLISQVVVILIAARLVGWVFKKFNQPRVIGEMAAGIMLGPSLFGWIFPGFYAALFPVSSLASLNILSQLGLILYMFIVGLEFDVAELRSQGHVALIISHTSIIIPLILGALVAVYLYPHLSGEGVDMMSFSLFMGTAMAITAFPVLARILNDLDLLKTGLGRMSIACASIDDATGWCVLAYLVWFIKSGDSQHAAWFAPVGLAVFMAVMIWGVRRLLRRMEDYFSKQGKLSDQHFVLIILIVLGSALTTEILGLHLVFGAFIAGAMMPKKREITSYLAEKFGSVTLLLMLPLFFAFAGLRTQIGLLQGAQMWFYCGLLIAVAIVGKLGGSGIAARLCGLSARDSVALGVLMNTRGLMELVILNVGLDIKVITPTVFSMMVIMALVTTVMTAPLLHWVYPPRLRPQPLPQLDVETGGGAMPAYADGSSKFSGSRVPHDASTL